MVEETEVLYKSDFHAHTSSFEDSADLIEGAGKAGITSIAIIGRGVLPVEIEKTAEMAGEAGVEVYFGVEDVFRINGERCDFVIFDVDQSNQGIAKKYEYEALKERSLMVLGKQISFLIDQGFVVNSYDEESDVILERLLKGEIYEKAINLCRLICYHPDNQELAGALWREYGADFVRQYRESSYDVTRQSPKFFWWLFFAVGRPGYFNTEESLEEIAELTHEAGGLLVFSPEKGDVNMKIMEVLPGRSYIDGVMGWHGGKLGLSRPVIKWLRENRKIILGGSDYNPLRNGESGQWLAGVGKGDLYISAKRLARERLRMNGSRGG